MNLMSGALAVLSPLPNCDIGAVKDPVVKRVVARRKEGDGERGGNRTHNLLIKSRSKGDSHWRSHVLRTVISPCFRKSYRQGPPF